MIVAGEMHDYRGESASPMRRCRKNSCKHDLKRNYRAKYDDVTRIWQAREESHGVRGSAFSDISGPSGRCASGDGARARGVSRSPIEISLAPGPSGVLQIL